MIKNELWPCCGAAESAAHALLIKKLRNGVLNDMFFNPNDRRWSANLPGLGIIYNGF